jgi:hypothetical protein
MNGLEFSYYFGDEADTYSFYRIPKALFSDPGFAGVSCEAKVLYGLMLDRMSLSIKNNWLDKQNRVFIYFTLEDAMECLNCGHDKGVKLMAELDAAKGIGLIERVKQGLGKPCKIYVKNFIRTTELLTSGKPKVIRLSISRLILTIRSNQSIWQLAKKRTKLLRQRGWLKNNGLSRKIKPPKLTPPLPSSRNSF